VITIKYFHLVVIITSAVILYHGMVTRPTSSWFLSLLSHMCVTYNITSGIQSGICAVHRFAAAAAAKTTATVTGNCYHASCAAGCTEPAQPPQGMMPAFAHRAALGAESAPLYSISCEVELPAAAAAVDGAAFSPLAQMTGLLLLVESAELFQTAVLAFAPRRAPQPPTVWAAGAR
jgi:hypothetical protein